jgi:hypothetical protein
VTVTSDRPVSILFRDETAPVVATPDGVQFHWISGDEVA